MEVFIKKLGSDTKSPSYAHEGDAGADLYSAEDKKIEAGEISKVRIGLSIAIPDGFVGIVMDKSGIALKGIHSIAGVVDSSFRGELEIVLANLGKSAFEIKKGQKVCQMVIMPVATAKITEAEKLSETKRGKKGFGSTGLD